MDSEGIWLIKNVKSNYCAHIWLTNEFLRFPIMLNVFFYIHLVTITPQFNFEANLSSTSEDLEWQNSVSLAMNGHRGWRSLYGFKPWRMSPPEITSGTLRQQCGSDTGIPGTGVALIMRIRSVTLACALLSGWWCCLPKPRIGRFDSQTCIIAEMV